MDKLSLIVTLGDYSPITLANHCDTGVDSLNNVFEIARFEDQ